MSIASEITRISGNIADAYTALDGKGATLPAAGSQNSANLADTIDTITTGGGGGGSSPEDTVRSIIDGITAPYTYGDADDDGWTLSTYAQNNTNLKIINENGQWNTLVGFVLSDDFEAEIYFRSRHVIKVPEGAVVTDVTEGSTSSGTTFKVNFSNASEKWFVIDWNHLYAPAPSEFYGFSTSQTSTTTGEMNYILKHITFLKVRLISGGSSAYTEQNPNIEYNCGKSCIVGSCLEFSPVIKDIELSNNIKFCVGSNSTYADRISWSVPSNIPFTVAPISHSFKLKKFINNCFQGVTYGTTQLTATVSFNIITKTGYNYFSRTRAFPFVLDCSNFTAGNFTWYVCSQGSSCYDNTVLHNYSAPQELFIIAPDCNVEWGGDKAGYSGTPYTAISLDSLKFFATNAPTVSGRTFKIGTDNYNMLLAQAPDAISTLTNKGWTVTA